MVDLPDELLIELHPPITFNGKTVDAISLHEPTVGQIEQAQKAIGGFLNDSNTLKFIQQLIVVISNQPVQFVSQMKITDVWKASAYLMAFITPPAAQKNEETSSPT